MRISLCPATRAYAQNLCVLGLCLILNSCAGLSPSQTDVMVFKPPTASASRIPPPAATLPPASVTPTATQPAVPPTPDCTSNLTFLEDISIPDGTAVQPEEILEKTWLVENSGTCNWESGYRLKLVAGPAMNVSVEQALYPARSGTQASIRLVFTAPLESGAYRSAWQAYDPQGKAFGESIFIDIVVSPAANAP
jgi:hypothetical protein